MVPCTTHSTALSPRRPLARTPAPSHHGSGASSRAAQGSAGHAPGLPKTTTLPFHPAWPDGNQSYTTGMRGRPRATARWALPSCTKRRLALPTVWALSSTQRATTTQSSLTHCRTYMRSQRSTSRHQPPRTPYPIKNNSLMMILLSCSSKPVAIQSTACSELSSYLPTCSPTYPLPTRLLCPSVHSNRPVIFGSAPEADLRPWPFPWGGGEQTFASLKPRIAAPPSSEKGHHAPLLYGAHTTLSFVLGRRCYLEQASITASGQRYDTNVMEHARHSMTSLPSLPTSIPPTMPCAIRTPYTYV
ncbi:hypothetical protein LX32DRAFT_311965 [Colletotrichum zoysiae]|uniref:Uncharacterized protein n=1 Tax=Colletotrichum zoysiae TaxID=1216348 RepID=A0AAD9H1B8_9PEZI|nr:hypothetical protein LX32DRAFT_311965 [Colletotrichum zoysiae]